VNENAREQGDPRSSRRKIGGYLSPGGKIPTPKKRKDVHLRFNTEAVGPRNQAMRFRLPLWLGKGAGQEKRKNHEHQPPAITSYWETFIRLKRRAIPAKMLTKREEKRNSRVLALGLAFGTGEI